MIRVESFLLFFAKIFSGRMRLSLRVAVVAVLSVLLWQSLAVAEETLVPTTKPAGPILLPELSRYFPVWTQAYLEVKDLNKNGDQISWFTDLFVSRPDSSFLSSEISTSTSDLAKQFDSVLRHNLNISSEVFFKDLLGEHFVLGWGGPLFRDQFGLICRVENYDKIAKFLTINQAEVKQLEGYENKTTTQIAGAMVDVKMYQLSRKYLSAAVVDNRFLILATTGGGAKASMFHAMVDLAFGTANQSLQQSPEFRESCSRLKANYSSLFVVITKASGTLFPGKIGFLFDALSKNVSNFAISSYPNKNATSLHIDIRPRHLGNTLAWQLPLSFEPVMRSMVDTESDLVYVSTIDLLDWYNNLVKVDEQGNCSVHPYREMVDLALPDPGIRDNLLETLGPELMLIVSSKASHFGTTQATTTIKASSTQPVETRKPQGDVQVALVVKTHNPTLTLDVADQIFNLVSGVVAIQNFASGSSASASQLRREKYHGFVLNQVDLRSFFPSEIKKIISGFELELTWTQVNNFLIISTSVSQVRSLIDRAFVKADLDLNTDVEVKTKNVLASMSDRTTWAISVNPQKSARDIAVLRDVLINIYQKVRGVDVRSRQHVPVVLGIGTKAIFQDGGDAGGVVKVAMVLPGYPSWEKLQIDDVIISVNGQAIDPKRPQKDLQEKIKGISESSRTITMEVLRNGESVTVEIPLTMRHFALAIQSMTLLEKSLLALSLNFDRIELACSYSSDGAINLILDLMTKPKSQISN